MRKFVSDCMFVNTHLRNGGTDLDENWYECRFYPGVIQMLLFIRATDHARQRMTLSI